MFFRNKNIGTRNTHYHHNHYRHYTAATIVTAAKRTTATTTTTTTAAAHYHLSYRGDVDPCATLAVLPGNGTGGYLSECESERESE